MAKGDNASQGSGFFPGLYQSAIAQTGQDYDSIMGQYRQLADRAGGRSSERLNFSPVSPTFAQYQPGSDVGARALGDFTRTGGYSEGDITNLRARGISPIRSIYANAQQNLNRQRALQGGYSPNYTAATAKMARESSNLISDKTSDVNAGIAEMVQRGKFAGASALAPLEAREAESRNLFERENAEAANRASVFNAQMPLQYAQFNRAGDDTDFNRILESVRGQQSLYGTTPALASTFGNQVLNAANTVNSFPPVIRQGSYAGSGYGGIPGGSSEDYFAQQRNAALR